MPDGRGGTKTGRQGGEFLTATYPNLQGSVFVVTYGRSGSTLVQRILQTLPDSCIRGENANTIGKLFEAYAAARTTRHGFGSEPRGRKDPWHGADHIRPDVFGAGLVHLFVTEILKPYRGVRFIGFKEIRWNWTPNLDQCLDFIARYFPDPVFVFSTRDIDAVARSSWWAYRPDQARETVDRMNAFFDANAAAWPGRVIRTRYEEFSTDPLALAPVFAHFGLEIDPVAVQRILDERLGH
jgi:hypothetical protein